MKKILISSMMIAGMTGLLLFSCVNKNNNNITPTYRNQSTGTGANPNLNNVTVTGTQTVTNPATSNTSLQVAGNMPGWIFEGYSSHPNTFVAYNSDDTTIYIKFSGAITPGTYALTSVSPTGGQAQMIVTGAPGQPSEIAWYSKSGTVTVSSFGPTFSATFSNIQCTQMNYIFPVVTVSGNINC
jgi:hypothetical protein